MSDEEREIVLAGGVWPLGSPEAGEAVGVWGFAAICIREAQRALAEAGLHSGPDLNAPLLARLQEQVAPGSAEDVALSLWATARNAQALLNMGLREGSSGSATVESAAAAFADAGILYAALWSMRSGLTSLATVGGRAQAAQVERARARAEQAEQVVMAQYGSRALEIANEVRSAKPDASLAAIIRSIRARAAVDQSIKLPADDSTIRRFLTTHGVGARSEGAT